MDARGGFDGIRGEGVRHRRVGMEGVGPVDGRVRALGAGGRVGTGADGGYLFN